MARPILSEYGPDAYKPQAPRAGCGGVTMKDKRDVMGYQPPKGPIGITRTPSPGLGGYNCGNAGTQGRYNAQGDLYNNTGEGATGSAGLGGKNRGMGTNRKG